jgi:hypothetical protein
MFNLNFKYLFILTEILTVVYVYYRYRKAGEKEDYWSNGNLYLLLLSVIYLIVPGQIYIYEVFRLASFKESTFNQICNYSIYYWFVFFIFYLMSSDRKFDKNNESKERLNKLIASRLVLTLTSTSTSILILTTILLFFIIITFTYNINLDIPRTEKYLIFTKIQQFPGFVFLSWFVIIWTFILAIKKNKIYYFLSYMPLIYIDLLLAGRYYLFVSAVAIFLYFSIIKKIKVKLIYMILMPLTLQFIGAIRDGFNFGAGAIEKIVDLSGELINTWTSIGLLLESDYTSNQNPFILFLTRLIPQPFFGFLFGEKKSYADEINSMHDFGFGMGSSILTEGFAYGSLFALALPIIIGLIYFNVGKKFNKNRSLNSSVIHFMLIINVFSIYRGATIVNFSSLISIYFIIYFLPRIFFMMQKTLVPQRSIHPS